MIASPDNSNYCLHNNIGKLRREGIPWECKKINAVFLRASGCYVVAIIGRLKFNIICMI